MSNVTLILTGGRRRQPGDGRAAHPAHGGGAGGPRRPRAPARQGGRPPRHFHAPHYTR